MLKMVAVTWTRGEWWQCCELVVGRWCGGGVSLQASPAIVHMIGLSGD